MTNPPVAQKETIIEVLQSYFEVCIECQQDVVTSIEILETEIDKEDQKGPDAQEIAESSFETIVRHWFQFALGFFEAFPMYGQIAQFVQIYQRDAEVKQFLDKNSLDAEVINKDNDLSITTYKVALQHRYKISKKIERLNQFDRGEQAILKAQLLALIAEYEAFIAELLRLIIRKNPESFISREATIPASEIIRGGNLEEIKNTLIEDRIVSLQRESHVNQIKTIFDKLKLAPPEQNALKEFGEICLRRNLLTHANGKVNRVYIEEMRKLGFRDEELPPIGTPLTTDQHYVKRATARVFQMGYFSLHLIWQHLEPAEHNRSIQRQINDSHDFLLNGYTKIAYRICEFMQNKKSPASELDRAYGVINQALSIFLNPMIEDPASAEQIEKILAKRDWSIVDAKFAIALSCLREEYDHLGDQIDACVLGGHIGVDEFLNWALFKKAREQEVFIAKMEEHFGIELEIDEQPKTETEES